MNPETLSYAPAILKLLQGPVYLEDTKTWALILGESEALHRHFAQIGLTLVLVLDEGFAYLSQEEDEGDLPRLVKRVPLGFEATILAVLLRDALEEFDLSNADSRDLFLTAKEIKSRLMPYLGDQYDEARVYRQFDRSIRQVVRLGFLRELEENEDDFDRKVFQVMRILKAKLGPEKLEEIRAKLASARGSGSRPLS